MSDLEILQLALLAVRHKKSAHRFTSHHAEWAGKEATLLSRIAKEKDEQAVQDSYYFLRVGKGKGLKK